MNMSIFKSKDDFITELRDRNADRNWNACDCTVIPKGWQWVGASGCHPHCDVLVCARDSEMITYWDVYPEYKQEPVLPAEISNNSTTTGGSCDYYKVDVKHPTTLHAPYTAECNDIAEALNLTTAEFNILKEMWRTANGRTHNNGKPDNDNTRAAEKVLFFAIRNAVQNGVDIPKLINGVNIS